jgi:hypothetical protein
MIVLFEDSDLRVSAIFGNFDQVVICFSGLAYKVLDIEIQTEEFFSLSNISSTIFVIDKTRSWGNNLDLELLRQIISPHLGGKRVHAVGNSMGGFLAVATSKIFAYTSVVAFVPQFSISKNIVPFEDRFDQYSDSVHQWKIESLENSFNFDAVYYIFGGIHSQLERNQLMHFPSQPNIYKFFFHHPDFDHNVAQKFKEVGILKDVLNQCFTKISPQELSSHWAGLPNFSFSFDLE